MNIGRSAMAGSSDGPSSSRSSPDTVSFSGFCAPSASGYCQDISSSSASSAQASGWATISSNSARGSGASGASPESASAAWISTVDHSPAPSRSAAARAAMIRSRWLPDAPMAWLSASQRARALWALRTEPTRISRSWARVSST